MNRQTKCADLFVDVNGRENKEFVKAIVTCCSAQIFFRKIIMLFEITYKFQKIKYVLSYTIAATDEALARKMTDIYVKIECPNEKISKVTVRKIPCGVRAGPI